MPNTKKKLLVFLSHASDDKTKVRSLCKQLRADGFDPWLDEERILPGQNWSQEIEKVLRVSDAILLCFSIFAVQKEGYIQREYKRAMKYQEEKPEGKIFVIPVRLDECETPFFIQELQWVDYPEQYERLVMALNHQRRKKNPSLLSGIHHPVQNKRVEIILEGEFTEFTPDRQQDIVSVLAALLRVDSNEVRVLRVNEGSILITIQIPDIAANRLYELAKKNDYRIRSLGIKSILIEGREIIELFDNGTNKTADRSPSAKSKGVVGEVIKRFDKTAQLDSGPEQLQVTDLLIVENNPASIHVQGIYGRVFDTPEFRNYIHKTLDVDSLRALRNRAFLMQDAAYQEWSNFDALIDEFKRNDEFPRLFMQLKENDPEAFRKFMKSHALGAIGVSPENVPDTGSLLSFTGQELLLDKEPDETALPASVDMSFVNKDSLFAQIHNHHKDYVVVYGPGGVGKTYFLQNFPKKFDDTRCVFIDLKKFKVKNVLPEIVRQLTGEKEINPAATYQDLVKALNAIHSENQHITRFFFLFDSADRNQEAVDYIFQSDSLIDNKGFRAQLQARKLHERVNIKIVLAARVQVRPKKPDSPFHQLVHIRYEALDRDCVQTMLEEVAKKSGSPVFPEDARALSDTVFHLTGGHPGCVRPMLLALNELGFVTPAPEQWIELYRQYVLPVIRDEMLNGLKMDTQMHIWNLCIFRRLDQRLLGGLIDRGVLSCPPGENSRLARELRPQLQLTQLFEPDHTTDTLVMNYALRYALTVKMQYESPERYKALHALALEIYLDRLHSSDVTSSKAAARTVMHLFEMVYHWARYLEIDIATAVDRASVEAANRAHLQSAFKDYLALSYAPFQKTDPAEFLRLLEEWWENDRELRETVQRATGNGECCQSLTQSVEQFVQLLQNNE